MKKEDTSNIKYSIYVKSFIIEIVVTAIFMAIFALIMYFTEKGYQFVTLISTICVAFGCFFAGFYLASKIGSRGLMNGSVIGIITFIIITLISFIVDSGSLTLNTLFHFIIFMLSSLIGGVSGVNKKDKNKKFFR